MQTKLFALICVIASLLAGCSSRSISNSGYEHDRAYQGELSELQVLGVEPGKVITNDDIKQALANKSHVQLPRGERMVLIQSGARFPDDKMVELARQHYDVVALSGVPARGHGKYYEPYSDGLHTRYSKDADPIYQPLDKALRLAAARTGAKTLVVYWGVLETEHKIYATKAVSWVPLVGDFIPDEEQETRIRLRAAVIDVETGDWEMMEPKIYSDDRTTVGIGREYSDQKQVALLKDQAYERLVDDLVTRYSR